MQAKVSWHTVMFFVAFRPIFQPPRRKKGQHRLRGQIGAILNSSASQDLHRRVLGTGWRRSAASFPWAMANGR